MGYTHYFSQNQRFSDFAWLTLTHLVHKLLAHSPAPLARESDEPNQPPEVTSEVIRFNGVDHDGHETFMITREHDPEHNFCKTARKPYDVVVCAVLLLAKRCASDALNITSDGESEDWQPARDLIEQVFDGNPLSWLYHQRLMNLYTVMLWHHEADGEAARLNGISRRFNMNAWACGTSACAYGSYALSKFGGPSQFTFDYREIEGDEEFITDICPKGISADTTPTTVGAALHFGIQDEEAEALFIPEMYFVDEDDDGEEDKYTGEFPRLLYNHQHIEPIHVLDRILYVMQKHHPNREHPVLPEEPEGGRVSRPV